MSLPAGTYIAEVFEATVDGVADQLALRLRRSDMTPAELELPKLSDEEDLMVIEVVVDEDGTPRPIDYIVNPSTDG
jgi:hypothetical protein